MLDLIYDSIAYLSSKNESEYSAYIFTAIDELSSKTAAQIIKKDDLKKINRLLRSNILSRLIILPVYQNGFDIDIFNSFRNYYEYEKDALINLKKYIKSNQTEQIRMPKYSFCGIVISAMAVNALENINKISKLTNLAKTSNYNGYHISLPKEMTNPSNPQFIKKIGTLNQNKKNS